MARTPHPGRRPGDRRRLGVALLLGAALVATGALAGRASTPERERERRAAPASTWVTAAPVRQRLADVRSGTCEVTAPTAELALPSASTGGTVTAVALGTGRPVADGTVVLDLSGRPVLALRLPFPLYRTIAPFDEGPDVAALQAALADLGLHDGPPTGRHDASSQAAVRALYQRAGVAPPATGDAEAGRLDAAEQAIADIDARLRGGEAVGQPTIDAALAERTAARRAVGTPVVPGEIAIPPGGPVTRLLAAVGDALEPGAPIARTAEGPAAVACTLAPDAVADLGEATGADLRIGDGDPVAGILGPFRPDEDDVAAPFTPATALPTSTAGSEATVEITVAATDGEVLTVPATALRRDRGATVVRTLVSGTPRTVPVTPGVAAGGWVEVEAPELDTRDRVIVADPTGP